MSEEMTQTVAPEPTTEIAAMDRVRLARDPNRPATLDYVNELFERVVTSTGDPAVRRKHPPGANGSG